MLILALSVLGLVLVPLTGGRWGGLVELRLRLRRLVLVAFALQLLVLQGPAVLDPVGPVLHVVTYLAAGVFTWANRAVPGLLLVAAGGASNGLTIAVNGGTLPASAAALRTAGVEVGPGFVNSGVVDDPVLPWLGDVFAVPAWVPLANVFSAGDVLILGGAWWLFWAATRRDPRPEGDEIARVVRPGLTLEHVASSRRRRPPVAPQARAARTADSGTSTQSGRFRVS